MFSSMIFKTILLEEFETVSIDTPVRTRLDNHGSLSLAVHSCKLTRAIHSSNTHLIPHVMSKFVSKADCLLTVAETCKLKGFAQAYKRAHTPPP